MQIEVATIQHIPSIQKLLMSNHVDHVTDKSNGYLTVSMTDQELAELIENDQAILVAVENQEVCGLVMAGPWHIVEVACFNCYLMHH